MEALLASFMSPSAVTVVAAIASAALGYWAKKYPPPVAPVLADVVPARQLSTIEKALGNPEALAVLKLVLERLDARACACAHETLQGLATPTPAVSIATRLKE